MRRFAACVRCGSMRLKIPSVGAGDAFIPGTEDVMGTLVCERCGYKAMPLSFDREEDWLAYRAEREREGWKDWSVTGEGMSAIPTIEAPAGWLVPGLLLAGGLFFLGAGILGLAVFSVTGNVMLLPALTSVLFGLGASVVGARLLAKRNRARGS